jgi:hypothetical protein
MGTFIRIYYGTFCRLSCLACVSYRNIYWFIGIFIAADHELRSARDQTSCFWYCVYGHAAKSATIYAIGKPTEVTNDVDQIK